jgi:hypothetical protein
LLQCFDKGDQVLGVVYIDKDTNSWLKGILSDTGVGQGRGAPAPAAVVRLFISPSANLNEIISYILYCSDDALDE